MRRVDVRVVESRTSPEGKKVVERTSPTASFRTRGAGTEEVDETMVDWTRRTPSSPPRARRGWVAETENELRDLGNWKRTRRQ